MFCLTVVDLHSSRCNVTLEHIKAAVALELYVPNYLLLDVVHWFYGKIGYFWKKQR